MKLCKDCRWAERISATFPDDYYCNQPQFQRAPYIHPISGEEMHPRWLCSSERSLGTKCGPDGKLWEPKNGAPGSV
jgi:hypothetical protein